MRIIERDMLKAVQKNVDWQSGNTRVARATTAAPGAVYLHGNKIATFDTQGEVTPVLGTFYNWPTLTTASRLRALGISAHISNGDPVIDGRVIITYAGTDYSLC